MRQPLLRAAAVLAAVLHVVLAGWTSLSPDEAHYALYAAHLDWSYFDHPPLVGWIQWPAVMAGGSDLALRIVPGLCWLLSAGGLVLATQRLFPDAGLRNARAALGLFLLSALPHLLGLALVPDSLLMPLTLATMMLCWQLCSGATSLKTWLLLGVCLGLAGLSKYTAVVLAFSALLVLGRCYGLRLLRQRGFWLAALTACALVSPVFVWNSQHDWISFAYQLGHAGGKQAWLPQRVAGFLAVQVLVYGALLLVGVVAALRTRQAQSAAGEFEGSRQQARQSISAEGPDGSAGETVAFRSAITPRGLCLAFGLPLLALLTYLSGRGSTLPHWSAPAWVALTPLAAAGCVRLWDARPRLVNSLAALQVLLCLAMAGLLASAGIGSEIGAQTTQAPVERSAAAPRNPVADLYGWDAAARRAAELAQARGIGTLAVMNWTLASRIAWYARPLPVKVVNTHRDQFDLWFGGLQPGESVLLVDWSLMSFAPPVGAGRFESCEAIGQQATRHDTPLGERQIAHFTFLHCRGWQGTAEMRNHAPD